MLAHGEVDGMAELTKRNGSTPLATHKRFKLSNGLVNFVPINNTNVCDSDMAAIFAASITAWRAIPLFPETMC